MGIGNREPSLATAVRELLGQLDKHVPDDGEGADLVLAGRDALEEVLRAVRPALKTLLHARIQELQADASDLFAGLDKLFGAPSALPDKVVPRLQEFAPAFEAVRCPKEYGEECSVIHSSTPHHHFRDADGTVKVHETVPKEEAHSECLDERCPGPVVLRKVEPMTAPIEALKCRASAPETSEVRCSRLPHHIGNHCGGGTVWANPDYKPCDAHNPLRPTVSCSIGAGHDGSHQAPSGEMWNGGL